MKLLYSSRIAARSPHGEGLSTGEEESDDQALDQHCGGGGGDRIVSVSGACHRVGYIRLDAVLPGPRHRGEWRRLTGSLRKRGGGRAPVLLCLLLVAFLGAGALPLWAQGRNDASTGTVYRRPLGHDPKTLDPARISDIYSLSVSQQIFDGLVQFDQTLAIKPALAEFWRASRDGLAWTFDLRKGAKFHHGREVTADDVVYSLTRLVDPKTHSGAADLFLGIRGARQFREGLARTVSGLVAVDRSTVQVTLDEALAPFVAILAVGHAKIVPRDLVEAQGEAFGTQPVGSGPFKFLRWEHGKEIVLTANVEHFEGPPKLARLVFRIFPGDQRDAMYDEFRRGGLEDAPLPSHADRRTLVAGVHHI